MGILALDMCRWTGARFPGSWVRILDGLGYKMHDDRMHGDYREQGCRARRAWVSQTETGNRHSIVLVRLQPQDSSASLSCAPPLAPTGEVAEVVGKE